MKESFFSISNEDQPLLPFRRDLKLFRGPPEATGAPTYSLYDPIKNKYYKISWEQSLIFEFMQPGFTASKLTEEINRMTTVHFEVDEIKSFFLQMAHFNLLQNVKTSELLVEELKKEKVNPIKWILLHYLFIRIPLFNPDQFLARTLHYVKPLASRLAFSIYFLIAFFGVVSLLPLFTEYLSTFTYFFDFEGYLFFIVGFFAVKLVHELSHAYTAKNYGVHVTSMGIMFILFLPIFYTDVSHGWRLKSRKSRLAISAAGVIAELVLAGLAIMGWLMTSPGRINSLFFILSSTSLLTSLFINLNPALRFDGYYLLSDLLGIDNLQSRAFAMTRHWLHKHLLGLDAPLPESGLSNRMIYQMIIYSIYTWIYRIFLYTAIALFVYFQFTKTLGVLLFVMEIVIFFIWPLLWEFKELKGLRGYFTKNIRLFFTSSIVFLFLLWLILPLPHLLTFYGVVYPVEKQIIYAPYEGVVSTTHFREGDLVKKGDVMITLDSTPLQYKIKVKEKEVAYLRIQTNIVANSDQYRALLPEKRQELGKAIEELNGLKKQEQEMTVRAYFSGTLLKWDKLLRVGQSVYRDQVFGVLATRDQGKIVFYIPEEELDSLYLGQKVKWSISSPHQEFYGTIEKIHPLRSIFLEEDELSSEHGGHLLTTRDKSGRLLLLDSYYKVEALLEENPTLESGDVRFGMTGQVEVRGPWRSKIGRAARNILQLFYRESST